MEKKELKEKQDTWLMKHREIKWYDVVFIALYLILIAATIAIFIFVKTR